MSSEYNGKRICKYMSPSQPEYEVRGNYIYIYGYLSTGQPILEIRGNYIYEHMKETRPVYEIRNSKYIHLFMWADQPLYEFW